MNHRHLILGVLVTLMIVVVGLAYFLRTDFQSLTQVEETSVTKVITPDEFGYTTVVEYRDPLLMYGVEYSAYDIVPLLVMGVELDEQGSLILDTLVSPGGQEGERQAKRIRLSRPAMLVGDKFYTPAQLFDKQLSGRVISLGVIPASVQGTNAIVKLCDQGQELFGLSVTECLTQLSLPTETDEAEVDIISILSPEMSEFRDTNYWIYEIYVVE